MLIEIFQLLVFPGLFFAALIGLLYEGILRKLSAHMHNRVGPPIWQPVLDFFKLMMKESIKPRRATLLFTLVPILAFSSVITVIFLVPIGGFQLIAFPGNLLIAIYLLILTSLLYALAGWASSSPFGSVGSIREITQLFAYEPAMVAAEDLKLISIRSYNNRLYHPLSPDVLPEFMKHLIAHPVWVPRIGLELLYIYVCHFQLISHLYLFPLATIRNSLFRSLCSWLLSPVRWV